MKEEHYNQSMKDAVVSDGWLMQKWVTLSVLRHYYERGGHIIALHDAIKLCQRHSNSIEDISKKYTDEVPDWVLKGCLNIVVDRIEVGFSVGNGQLGNEKAISQKQKQHLLRYLAVEEVRSSILIKGKKPSLNKSYKLALEKLDAKVAGSITWQTVRDSHDKLRAEINSSEDLWQYYPIKSKKTVPKVSEE